tara:strand:+ start:544 stop:2088 length:1545 start_codon:yes stop_codon:yes gene_type:complete
LFKSVFTVGFYTLISRILGFIRDIFIASYLGSTVIADAFFVAFRIPNYFRRIFAEGAFSAAFIPIFSGLTNRSNQAKQAKIFVDHTLSILFFSIVIIAVLFHFMMPYVIRGLAPGFLDNTEAYEISLHFARIVFPYLLFVALVAMFSSITNTYNRFAFGAFAPALLNITFIGCLIFLSPLVATPGHALSYGVIIGGILQFSLMYFAIYRLGFLPRVVLPKISNNISKFLKLLFPGMLGAGAIQLNIIVGTIIASFLPTGSISHLYYADRINQLPLAIFGIAMGVALLPTLSNYIKKGLGEKKIFNIQNRSLEFAVVISLPATFGIILLAEMIIKIFFEHGEFTTIDSYYTSRALILFAIGLPAYILIKVMNPSFFAREDTKTPLYVSLICVIINIIFSLFLIKYLRETGIALATSIAAWVNVILLFIILKKRKFIKLDQKIKNNLIKILFAAIIMGLTTYLIRNLFYMFLNSDNVVIGGLFLMIVIAISITVFTSTIFMLKIYTIEEIGKYLKK